MPPLATTETTRKYAARFAGGAAPGHFRTALAGLALSSIGIGTYLGEADTESDAAYAAAIQAAVRSGINVIDTAINYRFQRSERSIAAALQALAAEGFAREEVVLCTKGGYLTTDGEAPRDARSYREYFQREYFDRGICRPEEVAAGSHCMSPRYLEDQLSRSLRNLGVEAVDVYYLHNVETQLSAVSREVFRERLRAALEYLESEVVRGRIGHYGLATWNGFRRPPAAPDAHPLPEVVALAREVAGDSHHLRVIQVPYNLAMPEALTLENQPLAGRDVSLLDAAQELGVTVMCSASLMQARILGGVPAKVREAFATGSAAGDALQFVRSTPGVSCALVGMSRVPHVEENARLVRVPPAPLEKFQQLFG